MKRSMRLLKEEDIKGIFVTSAKVYVSANVLEELNKKDDIILVGYDISEEIKIF